MVALPVSGSNPIPSLPAPTRPVAQDELSKNRRFWKRCVPWFISHVYRGLIHGHGALSQHRHQRDGSHLNDKTWLFCMVISDHDAMQPLSYLRERCASCVNSPGESAVEPDGVFRCRLRPPTSQAATQMCGAASQISKNAERAGRPGGQAPAQEKKKKKTSMLHSRWQCLSGSCKHGRRMSRWIV